MIETYRELDVWQEAMMLVEQVYALSRRFPSDEHFGLGAQLRNAAVSIPSRIAAGNASDASGEYVRLMSLAAGSTAEVQTQLPSRWRPKQSCSNAIVSARCCAACAIPSTTARTQTSIEYRMDRQPILQSP